MTGVQTCALPISAAAAQGAAAGQVNAPHLVALMLLSLYQVLNLSKAIDKRGHAA